MMMTTQTLPVAVLRRIAAFLEDGKTGQIVLDVKEGRVMKAHASEYWSVNDACEIVDKGR